jgi:peptidoglycan-N-acetylglucosamine deacetylase
VLAKVHRQVGPGQVALTYDDGPHPDVTPRLLDVFGGFEAVATFFVVGERVRAHPDLVERMIAEGHSVGSHSMRHRDLTTLKGDELRREVEGGRDAVEAVVGRAAPLFRPPHGRLDARCASLLRARGWSTWLWTIDCYDWKPEASAQSIFTHGAAATQGDVLLLHDTCAQSAEATGLLLSRFREQGLEAVAL